MTSKTRSWIRLLTPMAAVLLALLVKTRLSSSAIPAAAIAAPAPYVQHASETALRQPTVLKPDLRHNGRAITSPRSAAEAASETNCPPLAVPAEPTMIVPAQFLSAPPIDLVPKR